MRRRKSIQRVFRRLKHRGKRLVQKGQRNGHRPMRHRGGREGLHSLFPDVDVLCGGRGKERENGGWEGHAWGVLFGDRRGKMSSLHLWARLERNPGLPKLITSFIA